MSENNKADMSFWGILSQRLDDKIPDALNHDKKAAELLMKIILVETVGNGNKS